MERNNYRSLNQVLETVYPEYNFQSTIQLRNKFLAGAVGWQYHYDPIQQRQLLEEYSQIFHLLTIEDWYRIKPSTIETQLDIPNLFSRDPQNPHSLLITLQTLYPEHNWLLFRFSTIPLSFYSKDINNQRQLFQQISDELGITNLDGWYEYEKEDVLKNGAGDILNNIYGGSLYAALKNIYPKHEWKPWSFKQVRISIHPLIVILFV